MNTRDVLAQLILDFEREVLAIGFTAGTSELDPPLVDYSDYKGGATLRNISSDISSLIGSSFSTLSSAEIECMREFEELYEQYESAHRQAPGADIFMVSGTESFRREVQLLTNRALVLLKQGIQEEEFAPFSADELPRILPADIRVVIVESWREATVSYAAECFMSSVAMCGRIIETYISALCVFELDIDPDRDKLGMDAMRNRLRKSGYRFRDGLNDQLSLIAQHRNKAVHGVTTIATRDQARGILSLTRDVLCTKNN